MSTEKKKRPIRSVPNAKPLAIKGDFVDVFKVIKKQKENAVKKSNN